VFGTVRREDELKTLPNERKSQKNEETALPRKNGASNRRRELIPHLARERFNLSAKINGSSETDVVLDIQFYEDYH